MPADPASSRAAALSRLRNKAKAVAEAISLPRFIGAMAQETSNLPTDARELTFLGLVDWEFLPAADTETAPSFPGFAAIQGFKSKQYLSGLAPKGCFISAEAIERVVRQIGETQKATRELSRRIYGSFDGFRHGVGRVLSFVHTALRIAVEPA
jgi:hypothetical protein